MFCSAASRTALSLSCVFRGLAAGVREDPWEACGDRRGDEFGNGIQPQLQGLQLDRPRRAYSKAERAYPRTGYWWFGALGGMPSGIATMLSSSANCCILRIKEWVNCWTKVATVSKLRVITGCISNASVNRGLISECGWNGCGAMKQVTH